MGKDAKAAAHLMAHASTEQKKKALKGIAEGLKNQAQRNLGGKPKRYCGSAGLRNVPSPVGQAFSSRQSPGRMIEGVLQVIELPDPVGEVIELRVAKRVKS